MQTDTKERLRSRPSILLSLLGLAATLIVTAGVAVLPRLWKARSYERVQLPTLTGRAIQFLGCPTIKFVCVCVRVLREQTRFGMNGYKTKCSIANISSKSKNEVLWKKKKQKERR